MSTKEEELEQYAGEVGMKLIGIQRKTIKSNFRLVSDDDLRPGQVMFLVELSRQGRVNMSDIAERTKVHPAVATRFLDRLEEKGLVERTREEGDRRIVWVTLTEDGSKLAGKIVEAYTQRMEKALAGTSRSERETLLSMLDAIDATFADEPAVNGGKDSKG